jgi:hypothetical protein
VRNGLLSLRLSEPLRLGADLGPELDRVLKYAALLYDELALFLDDRTCADLRKQLCAGMLRDNRSFVDAWLRPIGDHDQRWRVGPRELPTSVIEDALRELAAAGRVKGEHLEAVLRDPGADLLALAAPAFLSLTYDLQYHDVERSRDLGAAIASPGPTPTGETALVTLLPDLGDVSWGKILQLRLDGSLARFRDHIQRHEREQTTPDEVQREWDDVTRKLLHAQRPRAWGGLFARVARWFVPAPLTAAEDIKNAIAEHRRHRDDGWVYFVTRVHDIEDA